MSDDEEEEVGMQDDGLEDAGGQAYTMTPSHPAGPARNQFAPLGALSSGAGAQGE